MILISQAQARIMRNALETIAEYPAGPGSDPQALVVAIEFVKDLAYAATTTCARRRDP